MELQELILCTHVCQETVVDTWMRREEIRGVFASKASMDLCSTDELQGMVQSFDDLSLDIVELRGHIARHFEMIGKWCRRSGNEVLTVPKQEKMI